MLHMCRHRHMQIYYRRREICLTPTSGEEHRCHRQRHPSSLAQSSPLDLAVISLMLDWMSNVAECLEKAASTAPTTSNKPSTPHLNTALTPASSSLTWSRPATPSIASHCGRPWPGVDAQRTSSSSFVSSTCNRSSVMDWFRSISSGS